MDGSRVEYHSEEEYQNVDHEEIYYDDEPSTELPSDTVDADLDIPVQEDTPVETSNKFRLNHCMFLGKGCIEDFAMLGAMILLSEQGSLDGIDGYIASGGSSLLALLLSIGYTHQQVIEIATTTKLFNTYVASELGPNIIASLSTKCGWFNHERRRSIINRAISNKIACIPTFYGHYMATGKFLCFPAICVETGERKFFSHLTTPDVNIVDAVLAATNLPVLMEMFSIGEYNYIDASLSTVSFSELDNILEIENLTRLTLMPDPKSPKPFEMQHNIKTTFDYLVNVINSLVGARSSTAPSSVYCKELCIPVPYVDGFGRPLLRGQDEEAQLLILGYTAAKQYLSDL